MKFSIKRAVLLLLCIIAFGKTDAQSYTLSSVSETVTTLGNLSPVFTLSACTDYKFTYQITNSSSGASITDVITIDLPNGIQYSSFLSASGATLVNLTGGSSPSFLVTGWSINSTATIVFTAHTPPCNAINNVNAITLIHGVNSNTVSINNNLIVIAPSMLAINNAPPGALFTNVGDVRELVFKIQNNNTNGLEIPDVNLYLSPDPTISIAPAASAPFLGKYYVSTSSTSPALANIYTYNFPAASSTVSTPNTIGTGIHLGTTDWNYFFSTNNFTPGQILYIHVPYKVISCATSGSGNYTFTWGCGTTVCNSTNVTSSISVVKNDPVMGVTAFAPFDNAAFCTNAGKDSSLMGFTYKNTATGIIGAPFGNAKATDLKLYLFAEQAIGSLDVNTFQLASGAFSIQLPSTFITHTTVSYSSKMYEVYEVNLANLSIAQAGAWNPLGSANTLMDLDGDGKVDDLAEGGTFRLNVRFKYNHNCPYSTNCGNASTTVLGTQIRFNDQCGSFPTSDPRVGPFNVGYGGPSYAYSVSGGSGSLTLPNDVQEGYGNAFNATLCTAMYYERFGLPGFEYNCPNGYHQIKYNLAPGYHLNTTALTNLTGPTPGISTGTFQLPPITVNPRPTCVGTAQNITPIAQEFCAQGATPGYIIIQFGRIQTGNCGPGVFTETMNLPCINLPLFMDCQQSVPYFCSSTPANFGFDNMDFSLEFICDPGCSSCVSKIVCAGSSTYHHCIGSCDSYFTTHNDFKFIRQTVGSNNSNPLYDCTSSNPIVPLSNASPSAINLEAAYPGDVIKVAVTGSFSGTHTGVPANNGSSYNNIFLQIRHDDLLASTRANFRLFDLDVSQGGITITNANTATTLFVPCSTLVYTSSVVAGVVELNFNFSPAALAWMSSTTDQYNFSSDIYLIARSAPFVGTWPSFYSQGVHKLTNLRAEFMGTRPNPGTGPSPIVDGSCDSWGTYFTMLQPYSRIYVQTGTSNCSLFQVKNTLQTYSARWGYNQNDFSNEFRPYSTIDPNATFTIPPGYIYMGSHYVITQAPFASAGTNGFPLTSPGFISYPITGETVTGTTASGQTITYHGISGGTSCWPAMDLDFLLYFPEATILVDLQATCDALPVDTFGFVGGFTNGVNQNNPLYQYHTIVNSSQVLTNHVNPHLSINPPTSTVNAFTNNISFDFTICNNAVAPANKPWIAIENSMVNGLNLAGATVQILPSGPILPTNTYTDANGHTALMVQFPTTGTYSVIPVSTCYQLRLTTNVTANGCVPIGSGPILDYINVMYGNTCSGVATTTPQASCLQDSVHFAYQRYPSNLQLIVPSNGFPASSVDLCNGSLQYNFELNSSEIGSVKNPKFWVDLPVGISIQSVVFSYPCGVTTFTSTVADSYTFGSSGSLPGWNMNPHFAAINSNGLLGSLNPPNNKICVTLNLKTSCAYNANDYIKFYAGGVSSCSQAIIAGPAQHRPIINNANPADVLSVNSSMITSDNASLLNCYNTATVSVVVTNNGTAITNNNNTVTVNVPSGPYVINPGSGTLVGNVITWNIPSGSLSPAAAATYTFSISLNGTLYCQSNNVISTTVGYNQNVNCTASGGSCQISYVSSPTNLSFNACCQCQLSINTSTVNATCYGIANGTISANVLGAVSPITYLWSDGQTSQTAINLVAGTYSVLVTDANGCTITATAAVSQPSLSTVSISPSATSVCAGTNVSLCATAASTYLWSDGSNLSCINVAPLVTTTYSVVATDANGCMSNASAVVNVLPLPVVNVSPALQVICNGSSASLCASGAVNYSWSNGSNSPCINVSPNSSQTYTVVGTDGTCEGLPVTASVTVVSNPNLCMSPTQTICAGSCTTITARCDSIPSNIQYAWAPSSGVTNPNGITTVVCPNVTTTYTLTAVNTLTGCTSSGTVLVNVIPTPTLIVTPLTQTICAGTSGNICASGATTYQWSNGATTPCISGSPTGIGTHTVSVVGYNGSCESAPVTATFIVLAAPNICPMPPQTICSGNCITLNSICHEDQTNLTYSWSPSSGIANPNSYSVTVCPTITTTYTVVVTNTVTNCQASGTVTVNVITTPTITVSPSVQNICSGSNATICASGASNYTWSNGSIGACITVAPSSNTTYTVNGNNGNCLAQPVIATVNVSPPPILCLSPSQSICSGSCVTISARYHCHGVQPNVVYNWTPVTGLANPNAAATLACPTVTTVYTVVATNTLTGCSTSGTVSVNVTPTPTVTINIPSQNICAGTSALLCASGATTYTWSTGATSSCIAVTPTSSSIYTVTGSNGACVSQPVTATVTVSPKPVLCMSSSQSICSGNCTTISARSFCHGVQPNVVYSWSPTTGLANPNAATTLACPTVTTVYTVVATNTVTGCSISGNVSVNVIPTPTVTITPPLQNVCVGSFVSGCASGATTYSWSNGATTPCISGTINSVGVHTYTVTGYNGSCPSTPVVATVNVMPKPNVCMSSNQTICVGGCANISALQCHVQPSNVVYSWTPTAGLLNPNSGSTSACPTVTTTYTVVATNTLTSCSSSGTVTVSVLPVPVVNVTPPQTICLGSSATICASGATAYSWSNGSTGACINVAPSSTTNYTVTGNNGVCTGPPVTATVIVKQKPEIHILGQSVVKCNQTKTYVVSPIITSPVTSYSWTATNATPSSGTGTTANISFFWPGGTITWTATQAGNPCVGVATLNVHCTSVPNAREDASEIELLDKFVNVYPNPSDGNFSVEYNINGASNGEFVISDLLGKTVKIYKLNEASGILEIRAHELENGSYTYKLISNNEILETGKIVIMK